MYNNTQELKSLMALCFLIVNMRYKAQLPVKNDTIKIYIDLQQGSLHHLALGLGHCEGPEIDKMHTLCFGLGEFKTVLQGPLLNFVKTLLELTLDGMHMF